MFLDVVSPLRSCLRYLGECCSFSSSHKSGRIILCHSWKGGPKTINLSVHYLFSTKITGRNRLRLYKALVHTTAED